MKNVEIRFDEQYVLAVIQKANLKALGRIGAYVRGAAIRKVSVNPKPAAPGKPPHSRKGLLKRAIRFGVEPAKRDVLIGPMASLIGTSMAAHEFGGKYKRQYYKKRPLMGPTLEQTATQLPKFWADFQ